MGNCTGCEDQQTMEQRNEIFLDKSKKRCNENLKILRSSKKFDKENKEILKENKENQELSKDNKLNTKETKESFKESTQKHDAKPPLKPITLSEKSCNLPASLPEEKSNKYPYYEIDPKEKSEKYQSDRPLEMDEKPFDELEELEEHIPKHLQKLDTLPNYLNEHTQAVLEKLG